MAYLSIKQTSEKWGISRRRIQVLCSEGRIPGATKIGSYWAIPEDAEKRLRCDGETPQKERTEKQQHERCRKNTKPPGVDR